MVDHRLIRVRSRYVNKGVVTRQVGGHKQDLEVHHVVNDHLFMRWPDETF